MGCEFLAISQHPAGYLALDQPPSPVARESGPCSHGADRGARVNSGGISGIPVVNGGDRSRRGQTSSSAVTYAYSCSNAGPCSACGLALGALLPQLPELLRIVEQTGDAFLAHPDALTLALPCQGRREVPVVVFKHFAHPRER